MSDLVSRRGFLAGRGRDAVSIRPVGALPTSLFLETCTRCDSCISACPEGIIVRGSGGFPEIDFGRGACTFCDSCTEACDTGALVPDAEWPWRAVVEDSCLSASGVACRVCEDQCEATAIRFRLIPGGRSQPRIDIAGCTGCGACVAPCPADAIRLDRRPVEEAA